MDFSFTKEEEKFWEEVIDFVDREIPPDKRGVDVALEDRCDGPEDWEFIKSMRRKLGAKGWLALTWPIKYGGLARSHVEQLILSEEMTYRGAGGLDPGAVQRLGPVIMTYGSEYQKERFLLPIARGEMYWTQGFSEPEAGSDLASLKTRAVESGDYYIVNGQKVWQTHGDTAEWFYFLARTDPDVPKHKGISMFIVDLKTPGITVRPLLNIVDTYGFSEIFFDDVRIPKENIVGKKNQGWELANATLNAERSGIWQIGRCHRFMDEIIGYFQENGGNDGTSKMNSLYRQKLADMAVEVEVGRLFCYRVAHMQNKGLDISGEASISKLFSSEVTQKLSQVAMEILGLYGQLDKTSTLAPLRGKAEQWYLSTRARTIAGGTSEIQRTIIAQRGLGLPRA
jgi:alkylation response protein AidB-like acyl-CoA dehydrogenase